MGDKARRRSLTQPIRVRLLVLWLVALVMMLPWPLAGIMLNWSQFSGADGAVLFFGGVTMIPLAFLTLVGLPIPVLVTIPLVVWAAVAIVPGFWVRRRELSRRTLITIVGGQVGFSVVQASVGQLMVWTANV